MHEREFETYCFYRYCLGDFLAARQRLSLAVRQTDCEAQFGLIENAVVVYGRPFSGNRGLYARDGKALAKGRCRGADLHRLDPLDFVPASHMDLHRELSDLRNQLFAHSDVSFQTPAVVESGLPSPQRYWISVRIANHASLLERIADFEALIHAVDDKVDERAAAIEGQPWFSAQLKRELPLSPFMRVAPGTYASSIVADTGAGRRHAPPS